MVGSVGAEDLFGHVPSLSAEQAIKASHFYIDQEWAVVAGSGLHSDGTCACRSRTRCVNPGKHPYKGYGNDKRFKMNHDHVDKWWSQWLPGGPREGTPVDQVFIVPYLSGLVVADVDNTEPWEAGGYPDTLHTKSGSGRGGHWLYKYEWDLSDESPPSLPGKLPDGAGELKFRGVIVAPPSVHPSGGRYEWVNWDVGIAEAPEELLKKRNTGHLADGGIEIPPKSDENMWMELSFKAEWSKVISVGEAKSGRPVVMFAAAASMGPWIEGGWTTEDQVVQELLEASNKNGSLEKYGEQELTRQILNGIREGRSG